MSSRNSKEAQKQPVTNSGAGKQSNNNQNNDPDQLGKLADKERTRKPGSQSNSSGRHNNGRGGGK